MTFIIIVCPVCRKNFRRDLRHFNENIKLKQKNFCSLKCSAKGRLKRKILICENLNCSKKFERQFAALSKHNYCSSSCAAKISNLSRTKKIRICPNCKNEFTGNNKYCSLNCVPIQRSQYTEDIVLSEIKYFVKKHGRVPVKKEMWKFYKAARRNFGTWNRAIKTAGFVPNPVIFARKHYANDGHRCDSLAEKIIDDWLYARNINHERSYPYPSDRGLTVDFKVGNYWVEFFGLSGEHKRYDELKEEKIKLAKKSNLKLLALYPSDLFPTCKLETVLSLAIKGE